MKIVILAIVKLSLIALFGFWLYRKKVINSVALDFLTSFVINFSVPFLIFSQIVENFRPQSGPPFIIFIFLSIGLFLLGVSLSLCGVSLIRGKFKREFISLVSFQNCGYLPMNIALFLFPHSNIREKFLLYIFFYILGFNILMWSVGSFFIFRRGKEGFRSSSLFSPPIISIVVALLVVYLKIGRFIPSFILSPLKMVGETSFVLSMIILGSWLAKGKLSNIHKREKVLLGVGILKLILLPFLVFLVLIKGKIYSLLGLFIIIEAAMPSAASLPIVVNWHKGEAEFVSQGVFFTHLVAIFTVPLWIEVFLKVSGYSF